MKEKVPGLEEAVVERELAFSVDEYRQRQENVRGLMAERGLDVLVANTPENMYYLSGYNTPGYYTEQCLVLPLEDEPFILCRATEEMNVRASSCLDRSDSYVDDQEPVEVFASALRDGGFDKARIGVEKRSWFLTVDTYEGLKERLPQATFCDGSMLIEQFRMVKSQAELGYMRQAGEIAGIGLKAAYEVIEPGVTEDHVAARFNEVVTDRGSEWPGLPPFVASGVRSSFTHATYAGRTIQEGDAVLLELPAVIKRYAAAVMRTVLVGTVPEEVRRNNDTARPRPGESPQGDKARPSADRRLASMGRYSRRAGHRRDLPARRLFNRHQLPAGLGRGLYHLFPPRRGSGAAPQHDLPRGLAG